MEPVSVVAGWTHVFGFLLNQTKSFLEENLNQIYMELQL